MNWFSLMLFVTLLVTSFSVMRDPAVHNQRLVVTRCVRYLTVLTIYALYCTVVYFSQEKFVADEFKIMLFGLLPLTLFTTPIALATYLWYRPHNEAEKKEWAADLKRLKWRIAAFDREAFTEEGRTFLAECTKLFLRKRA